METLTLTPPPGAAPDVLEQRRGAATASGCRTIRKRLWNSVNSVGSISSSRATQDLSSGPYPSQSMRHTSRPPVATHSECPGGLVQDFWKRRVSPARRVLVQMKRIVKGGRRGRKGECGAWVEVVVGRGLR